MKIRRKKKIIRPTGGVHTEREGQTSCLFSQTEVKILLWFCQHVLSFQSASFLVLLIFLQKTQKNDLRQWFPPFLCPLSAKNLSTHLPYIFISELHTYTPVLIYILQNIHKDKNEKRRERLNKHCFKILFSYIYQRYEVHFLPATQWVEIHTLLWRL